MATPTAVQLTQLAKMGIAMPDHSYYIRNKADLSNAIESVGRAKPTGDESEVARRNDVRKFCMTRAKAMHLEDMIPDTWNSDGSLKQSAVVSVDDFLEHFGVKGMHWGVRGAKSSAPSSGDHAQTAHLLSKARSGGGIHVLNNDELKSLNKRLELETNFKRLTTPSPGLHEEAQKLLITAGKQEASKYAAKYAAKGAEWLAKEATKAILGTKVGAGKHAA